MSLPLQTPTFSDPPNHPSEPSRPPASAAIVQRLEALDQAEHGELPAAKPKRARYGWLIAAGVLVAAAGAGAFGVYRVAMAEDEYKGLEWQRVERGKIIFSIVEKGEVEAARNTDVICKVRAKSPTNSVASSIKWLVDDGTRVRRGDVIIRLDDSGLKDTLRTQESVVAEKRASLIQAQKELEISESTNRSNINSAVNNVELAKIDLEKWREGDLLQKQKDVLGRHTLAQSDLTQWIDKEFYSKLMAKRRYVSQSQAQADEFRRQSAEIALEKVKEERRVLDNFESRRTELDLQNKLAKAEEDLKVAEIQAKATEAQAMAKLEAAMSTLKQEESKMQDLIEDIRNCTITAPNDGMVVYYVPENSRFGVGSQTSVINLGETVREGQKLMRIPDLRYMQVKVKIHESLVPRLRGDRTRKTGFGNVVMAAAAASLQAPQSLTTLSVFEDLREAFLDHEETVVEYGLPCKVKLASVEQALRGHLKMVSPVASQTDWMASDVRVYPAVVSIDEQLEGLKPGMTAEVTIGVEEIDDVLRLPVHAVLEAGGVRFCYVKPAKGPPEKRILKTGLNNNKFIEVLDESDLREGELVIVNPRTLAEKRGDLQAEYRDPGEGLQGPGEGSRMRRPRGGAANGGQTSPGADGPPTPGEPGGQRGGFNGRRERGGDGPQGPRGEGSGGGGQRGPGNGGADFNGRRPGGPDGPQGPRGEGGADNGPRRPGGGGFQATPEQREQFRQFDENLRKATPAQRKQMIEDMPVPPNVKDSIKKRYRDQGVEIPD